MTSAVIFQALFMLAVITFVAYFVGEYMALVMTGRIPKFISFLRPLEKLFYRLFFIKENEEMTWQKYSFSLVLFSFLGFVTLYLLQRLQGYLPFNPQKFGNVRWDTALNTAISFLTNTNWQSYSGEAIMSYLTQMLGLAVHNFLSVAAGFAAAMALMRGFIRQSTKTLGSFWVDQTRCLVYIFLPLAIIFALLFVSNGVIQNLNPDLKVKTLAGNVQTIAQGPIASQEAIKLLGQNGGGFFNANSSHPYENPTPFNDFLEIFAILLLPFAFPFLFGALMENRRQGWALFIAMMLLFLLGLGIALHYEYKGNPLLAHLGVAHHGLNMEGKEVRNGITASVFFAQSTTVTSCGAVNTMHDSLLPITGLVPMFNIAIGEVIFGGTGSGLIGFLYYAILGMFLIGLMIGRTPEIYGKKLQVTDMIWVVIALIGPSIVQLIGGAIAISLPVGVAGMGNNGPHGLSEIFYAYNEAAGNNGSAFGGLNADSVFYNLTLAFTMLAGGF